MQSVVSAISMDMKTKQMRQLLKLLIRLCFCSKVHFKPDHPIRPECWLIDDGCTNHMTYNETFFKDLQPTRVTKARIIYLSYKPTTSSSTRTIFDILYVPEWIRIY